MLDRLKSFGWFGSEEAFRLAAGFVVTLLLARHLGPEEFGVYGYAFAVIALLTPLTVLGLDAIATKDLVEEPGKRGSILGTTLALRVVGCAFAFLLAAAIVAIPGGPSGLSTAIILTAAITLVFAPFQAITTYFKAIEKPALVAIPRIAITILVLAGMIGLIVTQADLASFVRLRALEAAGMALAAIASLVAFGKLKSRLRIDPGLLMPMIKRGLPLFISSLAGLVYMRIDQVMLGHLASAQELGRYTVAVRFSDSALFLPMALQAAFLPALVRARKGDRDSFGRELSSYFDIMALTMLAAAIAVGASAQLAIPLVLGEEYRQSTAMVWVLALGLPFIGLGVARSALLTIEGWLWTAPVTTVLGAVVNVALNLVLIPRWGGMGAAAASVFSYWLAAHGACYLLPWLRPVGRRMGRALNPFGVAARVGQELRGLWALRERA